MAAQSDTQLGILVAFYIVTIQNARCLLLAVAQFQLQIRPPKGKTLPVY